MFGRRARKVIEGINAVLNSGAFINREFIVNRFIDANFVPAFAERQADKLIAQNTDIDHFSRWQIWGTVKGQETYSLHPWTLAFNQSLNS